MSRLRQELFCTPSPMVFFFEPIMLASKQWMISLRIIKVHKPEPKAITEAEMIVAGWDATSGPGGACPWRFFSRSSTYLIKGGKCVAHLQLRHYIRFWVIWLPFKTLSSLNADTDLCDQFKESNPVPKDISGRSDPGVIFQGEEKTSVRLPGSFFRPVLRMLFFFVSRFPHCLPAAENDISVREH